MVTRSEDVVGQDVEEVAAGSVPKCFGVFFDLDASECKVCARREPCQITQQTKQGVTKVADETPPVTPCTTPAEAPVEPCTEPCTEPCAEPPIEAPLTEASPVQGPPAQADAQADAPAEEEPAKSKRAVPDALAFEPLRIRANTIGAYIVAQLGSGWWTSGALADKVVAACSCARGRVYNMLNKLNKAGLVDVQQAEGEKRRYKLKTTE